jgi:hypothetical protein
MLTEEDNTEYFTRLEDDKDSARSNLVRDWISRVISAKSHFDKDFKQIEEDQEYARGKQWGNTDKVSFSTYVANITHRQIQMMVSALYAKNPTISATRRKTLDYEIWDETDYSIQAAMMRIQQSQQMGTPPAPMDVALMQDYEEGRLKREQHNKIAKTMEILFEHYLGEQDPGFKKEMKRLVRRVCTCGVGYIKLGFQRVMEKRPEDVDKITDVTQQMKRLENLIAQNIEGEFEDSTAKLEELRLMLKNLQEQPDMIVKEGPVFDFPPATSIIVDPKCRSLNGFIGARWVAQEFHLNDDEIREIYGVDLENSQATTSHYKNRENDFDDKRNTEDKEGEEDEKTYTVWEIYSKTDGLVYVVAEGYDGFLTEPTAPLIKLERFWPFFPLIFNEVENEKRIYPPSDVSLMRPMQDGYNKARAGYAEHKEANRPGLVGSVGAFTSDEDKQKLFNRGANQYVEINLPPNQSIKDMVAPVPTAPVDPRLYEVNDFFIDIQRVTGAQEANLGGMSGGTATESSIAESSRMSSLSSSIDELDDLMTDLARATGQLMFQMLSIETVKSIAGRGAAWPDINRNQIAQDLTLTVKAGSSGRANKAVEVANFQKLAPILMQMPFINPQWLAKLGVTAYDDRTDLTEAITDKIQSIMAINAAQGAAVSNPGRGPDNAPEAQGAQGANNSPKPQGPQDGSEQMNPGINAPMA